ncbi:hypothetical protein J2858_003525 [Neorhizobium galegae]|uniref:hypothetical protein n=1 Tax=Rhizobium/Agrobacterium group TaxID=227290 RepID=UPI001AE1DE20|nr:hypothetical protein [Neorhizobium galegae]MBP2550585.1 hypothetical protein [Neorhizobium galegae]
MQGEISYDGCEPGYGEADGCTSARSSVRDGLDFVVSSNGVFKPFLNETGGASCYAGGVAGRVYMISWGALS